MKDVTKQILFTIATGLGAALLVHMLHFEKAVLASLDSNSFLASSGLLQQFRKSFAEGELWAHFLCYLFIFSFVALPAFSLSRNWPIGNLLRKVAREGSPLLVNPKQTIEPLLIELGITKPLSFFGRAVEMAELDAFAESPEQFLWWSMHGGGGVGKTRLAAEWMLGRSASRRLDIGFLNRRATTIDGIQAFRPRRDTVIVIDEAVLFASELWIYLATLASNSLHFQHKVRVLLIDWTALADPPNAVLSEMEKLMAHLLMNSRHYQTVRESTDRPSASGWITIKDTSLASPPRSQETLAKIKVPRESLAISSLSDRSAIEGIVRDVAGPAGSSIDIEALTEATQGNPLLIVASALHPEERPHLVIERMAGKLLGRAEALDRKKESRLETTLVISALAGPVDHPIYAKFTGCVPNHSALTQFFAQPRALLRSTLPALEPELLAHEVALQHLSQLNTSEQDSLASHIFEINPQRALRLLGNMWKIREEAAGATAFAAGLPHLVALSDEQKVTAQVLHSLMEAAFKCAEYNRSPLRREIWKKALGLFRTVQEKEAGTDDDAAAILKLVTRHALAPDYSAVFDTLKMRHTCIPAVIRAMEPDFDSSAPLRQMIDDEEASSAILEAIAAKDPIVAAAAAIEVMQIAYHTSQSFVKCLNTKQEARLVRIADALTKRAVDGPDEVLAAVAWASAWLSSLSIVGGRWFNFSAHQNKLILDGLQKATLPAAICLSAYHLGEELSRPLATGTLLKWAEAIDAGETPHYEPIPSMTSEDSLRNSLVKLIAHHVAFSNLDLKQLGRLGISAIKCDALGEEMRPAIEAKLSSQDPELNLLNCMSLIATSSHDSAVSTLKMAFEKGSPKTRFFAFLGLWGRGETEFAQRHIQPTDLADYTLSKKDNSSRIFTRKLISLMGGEIHKLSAKDTTGEGAYYFVLVPPENEALFLDAIGYDGTIELENFGKVVASCYGNGPNNSVKMDLKNDFGFDV